MKSTLFYLKHSLLLLALQTTAIHAAEITVDWQGFSPGALSLNKNTAPSGFNSSDEFAQSDFIGTGVGIGTRLYDRIHIDLSYFVTSNFDFMNMQSKPEPSIREFQLAAGWQFPITNWFCVEPRAGVSKWKLKVRNGFLLNPGPNESNTMRGTDAFWSVRAVFGCSKQHNLYIGYRRNQYDFGEIEVANLGYRINF